MGLRDIKKKLGKAIDEVVPGDQRRLYMDPFSGWGERRPTPRIPVRELGADRAPYRHAPSVLPGPGVVGHGAFIREDTLPLDQQVLRIQGNPLQQFRPRNPDPRIFIDERQTPHFHMPEAIPQQRLEQKPIPRLTIEDILRRYG